MKGAHSGSVEQGKRDMMENLNSIPREGSENVLKNGEIYESQWGLQFMNSVIFQ
jgi:hypothetical protein